LTPISFYQNLTKIMQDIRNDDYEKNTDKFSDYPNYWKYQKASLPNVILNSNLKIKTKPIIQKVEKTISNSNKRK
jgi:hypothetical protein